MEISLRQDFGELNAEAGVAINPGTPRSVLEEVLDLADLIQVMTVNPGWGGQPFIHSQLDKVRRLRRMLDERGLDTTIAVDGGTKPATAPLVVSAGATCWWPDRAYTTIGRPWPKAWRH